jgi:hypothetical protein
MISSNFWQLTALQILLERLAPQMAQKEASDDKPINCLPKVFWYCPNDTMYLIHFVFELLQNPEKAFPPASSRPSVPKTMAKALSQAYVIMWSKWGKCQQQQLRSAAQ